MSKPKRVAIYVRVSTDAQNTDAQRQELEAWAERAGHTVMKVYEDQGISGAKGRGQRPAFDALLKAAVRREINMIAVWSSDRLGRSLKHLVEVLEIIRATGTGLYIHTQAVDTTTPAGRAMFGMLGIFAEFEREMIQARVVAGIERVRGEIQRNGRFTSKAGKVRKRLGRPNADPKKVELARQALANGTGVLKTAKLAGLGTGTVQRLKRGGSCYMTKTPRIRAGVFPTSGQPIALDRSACWLRLIEACRNAVINPLYQPGNRIFGCCEHNVVLKDVI